MRPIIEFCVSNLASGSQKAMEELEKDPNLDIVEYGCTSNDFYHPIEADDAIFTSLQEAEQLYNQYF